MNVFHACLHPAPPTMCCRRLFHSSSLLAAHRAELEGVRAQVRVLETKLADLDDELDDERNLNMELAVQNHFLRQRVKQLTMADGKEVVDVNPPAGAWVVVD